MLDVREKILDRNAKVIIEKELKISVYVWILFMKILKVLTVLNANTPAKIVKV